MIPEDYRTDVTRAIELSRSEGCHEVYIFGSVASGTPRAQSDLDIAVRGCPPERFYRLLGKLMVELTHPVDLIDLDLDRDVAEFLEREGHSVGCWTGNCVSSTPSSWTQERGRPDEVYALQRPDEPINGSLSRGSSWLSLGPGHRSGVGLRPVWRGLLRRT